MSPLSTRIAPWARVLASGRALGAAFAVAIVVASGAWLYKGEDDRGKTARLTADAWYYHAYLPSLLFDRDLDLSPQYEITGNWYRLGETEIGKPANVFGIGPAVYTAPFFLAGHAYARLDGEKEANGFSRPEILASVSASWLASLAALIPAALLIRRRLGDGQVAWLVPLLLAAAGPVVYYAVRQPGYAHPFSALFVAWLVERWDASFRDGGSPRPLGTWLALGALIGASALARPQCALWAVILLAAAADDVGRIVQTERGSRRLWAILGELAPRWLAGAALSLLVFSPQLFAWKAIYGTYYTMPQGEGFMWWGAPAWSEVLFSSRNGLFPWAPLYALAAIGLFASALRTPRVGLALLVGVALQVVANGAAWDWWAGGSFGGRRFDSTFIAFAYGLGALVVLSPQGGRALGWWRAKALGAALVVLISLALAAANVMLAASYSAPTVRIEGGTPASDAIRERVPSLLGSAAAAASRAANAPARWGFAWRHGTDGDAYDLVVGVHYTGELYPGLNSFRGRRRERVPLEPDAPHVQGVSADCEGCVAIEGDIARVWVGLNRRDAIRFQLRAAAPAGKQGARAELSLDGGEIASGELDEKPSLVEGRVERARRGVNVLEIRAPSGTELHRLDVRATSDPLGKDSE